MVESINDTLKMATGDLTCLSLYHYILSTIKTKLHKFHIVTALIEQDHFLICPISWTSTSVKCI